MTIQQELDAFIERCSKGKYMSIEEVTKAAKNGELDKELRRVINKHISISRKKAMIQVTDYATRYERIKTDKGNFIKDKVTGEFHSEKRMMKKDIKKSLARPSGRQLKKELRYLRWMEKQKESAKTGS